MDDVPKNKLELVNFRHVLFSSWSLKMGLIGCPETLVRNSHSTVCNIPQERRSHMTILQCKPRFGSARSSSEQSGSVLHKQIKDLTYLRTKIKEKSSSYIWVNMALMLCRKIITLCSDSHAKHLNTFCGWNIEFLNVKLGDTHGNH